MSFRLDRLAAAALLFGAIAYAADPVPEIAQARQLYRGTNFQGAIDTLKPLASKNPEACLLIGESYMNLGNPNKAVEYFSRAVELDPSQATYYLWLGRAYGRKAELDFPLAAPRDAAKARANMEKALDLDPTSQGATDDLFEFYLAAPGFLGGGLDKAASMAAKIAQRDPIEGKFAEARLAEARKDYSTAEAMLRRAIELAPKQPRRLLDLAVFLSKRGRYEESDATFREARKFAPEAPRVLFREASTYIHANRKPEEARELLKQYLASANIGPDDPSKGEALKLLSKVSGS